MHLILNGSGNSKVAIPTIIITDTTLKAMSRKVLSKHMCTLTATYRYTLSIEQVLIHCLWMLNAKLNVTSCPPPSWSLICS